MAHRSRAASLRRTSQSAVASSCKTVARSRVTFFTGRCRSTRTLCLKGHHGESKIQRTYRRSRPRARRKKTCRVRPWPRICSALKHRHPLTGPSPRLSRSIRARIPAEGANILVEVRTRLRGSLHEIAGRQALYHGRWPQDERYSRRCILGGVEGNRSRAKHYPVGTGRRDRFRALAWQSVIGHSPLRTLFLPQQAC